MFLKVKQWVNNTTKNITINTDQITCYSEFKHIKNSTEIYLSNNQLIIILQPVSWFDDVLVYKNQDPTPVKEIDDHIIVEGNDNPLDFSTDSEMVEENQDTNERMATEKQISYMKSIREKKGLNVKFPNYITFKFAKEFLDKYAPKKKKPTAEFDWEQLDEDADGEFPGYRD